MPSSTISASDDSLSPTGPTAAAFLDMLESFGIANAASRPYFLTHFERYRATLDLIDVQATGSPRILELGGESLAFTLMLRDMLPAAEILVGAHDGGLHERERLVRNLHTGETLAFQSHSFNIEEDVWPLADGSLDCILCMEIIEHLMLDPCHVFREAHRVLRPGGGFLVTTPNITSYEAVQKVFDLDSPYSYGVYSSHGAYGRHNREFTPGEIARLGESSGFETEVLTTRDVYPPSRDTSALREILGARLGPEHLRHQNIFYHGVKTGRPFTAYPVSLYDYDPELHRARIAVSLEETRPRVGGRLRGRATLTNAGTYTWEEMGETPTELRIVLATPTGGIIERGFRTVTLPEPVAPQQTITFEFDVAAPAEAGDYLLRFDLLHVYVCWFSDLRTKPAEVAVRVFPDA